MTFGPGELLMIGAESRMDSSRNVEVEFQFLYSPSSTGAIDGISYIKGGWQYLWVYSKAAIQGNGEATKILKTIYVADIYESTNFGNLFS